MSTYNVELTPQQDRFVQSEIESGRFQNENEVMQAALFALELQEHDNEVKMAALRRAVDEGFDSGIYEGDVFEEARAAIRAQAAKKN